MKALSLYQPWATLVAMEQKKIETRSWQTSYRGTLAIHASKNTSYIMRSKKDYILDDYPFCFLTNKETFLWAHERFPLGAVIALARLVDCLPTDQIKRAFGRLWIKSTSGVSYQISEREQNFGDYSPGRYMWFLDQIVVLHKPVPARGAMMLWEWDLPDWLSGKPLKEDAVEP